MPRKPATAASAASKPAAAPWTVAIDGHPVPLAITADAIVGIERHTGRTLFQHADAASRRAVPLRDLAIILRYLAGVGAPIAALRGPPIVELISGEPGVMTDLQPQHFGETAEAVIVRNGLIEVLAAVMLPIVAAMKAGTTTDGLRRPGYVDGR